MQHRSLHLARLAIVGCVAAMGLALHAFAAAPAPIYPDIGAARHDLATGAQTAVREHKRLLVDFGGNWCGDCKALDANFHKPENAALLDGSFVLVHVNVGDAGIDHNFDVAEQYGIPLKKGVPALAVVDPASGKALYAQTGGEFEDMRHMDPASVNEFLTKWKP